MAEMPNVIGGETITSDWGNKIRDRSIQRYATVAARTASIPTPTEGDLSYLQDANTVDVYTGSVWTPLIGTNEVDGAVEVTGPFSVTGTAIDAATVNLPIPSGWGSWKCEAHATFATSGTSTTAITTRIRVDGTDLAFQVGLVNGSGAVAGRRTGMTTTGSRAITLRASGDATSPVLGYIYLYARAVRTS